MPHLNRFYQPQLLTEALEILANTEGKVVCIAGGTDVLPAMMKGSLQVDGLLDLTKIPELKQITIEGDVIKVGSGCTFSQIENSTVIKNNAWVLAEAAALVGAPQTRNLGTIGGNIANASPAADSVSALAALHPLVKLESLTGARMVPLGEVLCGVGKTNIRPDEILVEISFQRPPANSRMGFIKLGRRKALAISRMSSAMIIGIENEIINFARVSLGAVGPNPSRSEVLEEFLIGQKPSDLLIDQFTVEAEKEVTRLLGTRPSADWKRKAVKGITRELLNRLFSDLEQGVSE